MVLATIILKFLDCNNKDCKIDPVQIWHHCLIEVIGYIYCSIRSSVVYAKFAISPCIMRVWQHFNICIEMSQKQNDFLIQRVLLFIIVCRY